MSDSLLPRPQEHHIRPEIIPPVDGSFPRYVGGATHNELAHYWRVFYGRRWLLLATSLLGLAVAVLYTVREPRLYQAQATVEFKSALPPGKDLELLNPMGVITPALAARLLSTKMLAARVITTEREKGHAWFDPKPEATPPSVLRTVWDRFWLVPVQLMATARLVLGERADVNDRDAPAEDSPDAIGVDLGTVGRYYSHISIRPVPMTSLADIVVTHPAPSVSATLANAHAEALIAMDAEAKAASLGDAQSLFRQQLDEVKTKLEASRKALSEYQSEHGILSLPKDNTTITRESLQQLNKLLTEAQGERIVAEAHYRNAIAMAPDELGQTLPDDALKSLRDKLLALKARYEANLNAYGRNHPDMIAMRAEMTSLRGQLRAAGLQARTQLHAAFVAAQAKERELHVNFEQLSQLAQNEDRGLVQLLILQRDLEANQDLYKNLLQQAKEADLTSGVFRWTSVKLVDRAVEPTTPSYPRTTRNLEFGVLFGFLSGLFACLLIERVDTRIHTPDQASTLLHLPTYGVVPDFRRLRNNGVYGRPLVPSADVSRTGRELVTLLHPASAVSEAYRGIRTNLMFSSPGHPPKTILITSSQAGEGKTVTVVNLAVSLALSGARVLIIDADLRKPGCHNPLQVLREPGLSSVLTGQCDVRTAVVPSPLFANGNGKGRGVYVLPAGANPPNPSELLGSHVMGELLASLKDQFEFVLIDSPPLLPVTDSVVISTKADGVLLVIKGGEWGRDVVQRALTQLEAVRARVLGTVLNCVDIKRGGSPYYYYRHYYGSYYGRAADENADSEIPA